ncbi:MAG TPA: hypothetical protein VJS66_09430 [Burkholderiales bacterium]|nr:hypothetical protein [Burkholderiales bacterium]
MNNDYAAEGFTIRFDVVQVVFGARHVTGFAQCNPSLSPEECRRHDARG